MNVLHYIQMLPACEGRISEAKEKIKDFIFIGSPDSTQPSVTGGLPGNATAVKALRLADLHEHIERNEAMIEIIHKVTNVYIQMLPNDQQAAIRVRYMMMSGLLEDRIKTAYGKKISASKYFKDLRAAKAALKSIEV